MIIQKENVYVLEVNPRLSASFDLYTKNWREDFCLDLIKLHILASLGEAFHPEIQKKLNKVHVKVMQAPANHSNAMAIIYAKDDLQIDSDFKWPDWVQDRPFINQLNDQILVQNVEEKIFNNKFAVRVLKGHPVCSVIAQKSNIQLAKKELKIKVKLLTQHLNHWHD